MTRAIRRVCLIVALLATSLALPNLLHPQPLLAQDPPTADAQSRSGPARPRGAMRGEASALSPAAVVIPGVPSYIWHHGCGPTAAGMILGYWDGRGFDQLVAGSAALQTEAVNAMIASEGEASNYSDYCLPIDDVYLNITPLSDLSMDPVGDEHPDNCIADYMKTSQSRHSNYYGWSWFSHVGPAIMGYVESLQVDYRVVITNCSVYDGTLDWRSYCAEIDAGRPVLFLVDSTGDGLTDHFVTAVGYDVQDGTQLYGCLDTWDSRVHWYAFRSIGQGRPWGIWGGVMVRLSTSSIQVETNRGDAPWQIFGPANYSGFGPRTILGAPAGTYQIIWGNVGQCTRPAHQTLTLLAGETIAFRGDYVCAELYYSYFPLARRQGTAP